MFEFFNSFSPWTIFFLGFAVGIFAISVAGHFALRYVVKKNLYASATFSPKRNLWRVNGQYLMISAKLQDAIKTGSSQVKYVD